MKSESRMSNALRGLLVAGSLFAMTATDSSLFIFRSSLTHAQNVQRGIASYYSKRATGRKTSNGERLHHDSLTCAHRTYPFGTMLKVTNPANGKTVTVRVTDRGPFGKGRIIDLSWRAAKELGILTQGIAQVTVEKTEHLVIPFKPIDEIISLPELTLETTERTNTIKPLWQELAEERQRRREQEATAQANKEVTGALSESGTPSPQR